KLNWLTDEPVWVEQWPLSKQKLKVLSELVEEQLQKGNIKETTSPWNSPVFVIQKADKTRWRLLPDLRKINEVIQDMRSLQPGMPSPTMLPQNWNLTVIDIKDCFFQIPLHPDDAPRFAFSVPTINREAPRKRYHWKVLPQGMKNSPVICQWYVSSLLAPRVQDLMSTRQAHRCKPDLPFRFIILGRLPHLQGLIFQWDKEIEKTPRKDRGGNDPLCIIEWVFLSHHRSERMTRLQELMADLIQKARLRLRELAGCDFECIHMPIQLQSGQITKAMLEHLLQENEALQFALDNYSGQISIHRPAHKIFNSNSQFQLELKSVQSKEPLDALTIFTDASGRSHKSVMTWRDPHTRQWESDVEEVEGSPQVAELAAVVRAFERFTEPFNLVTDSAYVAGVVSRAENSVLQEVSNIALFELLSKLVKLISRREQPFYMMHVRSHTDLPGV
ncbi:POK6 protein, partial [Pomatorhinus ruficollis]|nr:POK6 protein [Pomatorhinus ruficollis]